MAHLYSLFDFYIPYGNFNFILVLVLKFPGSLNLSFYNLSIHQFSRKNLSLAQFIPRIYNKIIIKILGYFWGVTPTAREPERASSPLVEAPVILSPPISSKPDGGAKSPLNAAAEQSLVVMPITVWNPPLEKVQSPPRKAAELKRKKPKAKVDKNKDSLLSNAELVAGAVSSILRDSDFGRSKAMLVDEALALSLQGVASVSLQLYLLPCYLHVER